MTRAIMRIGECSVTELVYSVGMRQPGVSRHLKVLRDAGHRLDSLERHLERPARPIPPKEQSR